MVITNKEKLWVKPKPDGRHEMKSLGWPDEQQNYSPGHYRTALHSPTCAKANDKDPHAIFRATVERAGFGRWIASQTENK